MKPPGATYGIGRWLFLRGLGLVYLIAFVSLWTQVDGLIGSDGILPVADYLDRVRESLGGDGYLQVPTLLWLADGDAALHVLCGLGVVLSLLLIVGVAPIPVLVALWAAYLSLVQGGQAFLSFQWDTLLLETGFCALFVAPDRWRPLLPHRAPPPFRPGLWLLWVLLFKLMFLSGAVKPLSMDATWWELTALDYHYWTQPIPNGASWYADRLPAWFQKLSILVTYGIEIALPFLIFVGHRGRRIVAFATAFLMLMISWTGNYGFFNLLTLVLCLSLVDDRAWSKIFPANVLPEPAIAPPPRIAGVAGTAAALAVAAIVGLSSLTVIRELARTVPRTHEASAATLAKAADRWVLTWGNPLLRSIAPFRTINGYGLFRSMTTERPEIVLEGSNDGTTWVAYEFPWKPGDPARAPRTVAPHMPRLDWQMWFAALNPRRAGWLSGLMRGVLKGSPAVLDLLDSNPFPDAPPRYVRLVYYRYRFASPEQRQRDGVWWSRERSGLLTGALDLERLGG